MSFPKFIKSFKSGWGAVSAAVTAGPVALLAADLTPPWPSEGGGAAAALATLGGIVGLFLAYIDGAGDAKWRQRSSRALKGAIFAALVLLASWSLVVVPAYQKVDGTMVERRFVVGLVMNDLPERLTAREAIKKYGLDSAYSPLSLLAGRLLLLGSWLALFLLLTYGSGLQQAKEA